MPDSPDLLALERALLALIAEHAAAPVPDGDPAEDEARYRRIRGLEARIARAPARTPAEVAVKLRRLAAHETMGGRHAWTCKWSADLMHTALAALDLMETMADGKQRRRHRRCSAFTGCVSPSEEPKRMRMLSPALVAALLITGPTAALSQAGGDVPGDPATGRGLAEQVCWACHVIPDWEPPAIEAPGAQPFEALAADPAVTEMALRAFLLSSHPTMPNFIFSDEELNDIIAYILSLKDG